jgi:hypothetical protein
MFEYVEFPTELYARTRYLYVVPGLFHRSVKVVIFAPTWATFPNHVQVAPEHRSILNPVSFPELSDHTSVICLLTGPGVATSPLGAAGGPQVVAAPMFE